MSAQKNFRLRFPSLVLPKNKIRRFLWIASVVSSVYLLLVCLWLALIRPEAFGAVVVGFLAGSLITAVLCVVGALVVSTQLWMFAPELAEEDSAVRQRWDSLAKKVKEKLAEPASPAASATKGVPTVTDAHTPADSVPAPGLSEEREWSRDAGITEEGTGKVASESDSRPTISPATASSPDSARQSEEKELVGSTDSEAKDSESTDSEGTDSDVTATTSSPSAVTPWSAQSATKEEASVEDDSSAALQNQAPESAQKASA